MKHVTKKICLSFALLGVFYSINIFADNTPTLTDSQVDDVIMRGTDGTPTPLPASLSASDNQANNTAAVADDDLDNDGINNENDPDVDNDGINNQNDPDDDNDGVADVDDAYPYDRARAVAADAVINNNNNAGADRRR